MVQPYGGLTSVHVSVLYSTERAGILWELDAAHLIEQGKGQEDMGWDLPAHRQWIAMTRHWCHLVNMEHTRLNKRVFNWAANRAGGRIKNWCFRVRSFYCELQMNHLTNISQPLDTVAVLQGIHTVLL